MAAWLAAALLTLSLAFAPSDEAAAQDTEVRVAPGDDLAAVVESAPAGATFVLEEGVYRAPTIFPRDGDTFRGEPGAVLNGARVLEDFEREGEYWVVGGQTQEGHATGRCGPSPEGGRLEMCVYPEQLFIDGVTQAQVDSLDGLEAGEWYFDYEADAIYVPEDPAGKLVETSVVERAFDGTARDVTITGLIVEKYANPSQTGAIHGADGAGWTVEHNIVRLNHGLGIRLGPGMVVRGNQVVHNGQMGLGGSGDDILVVGNEIAFNNTAGFAPGWEAGGTKFVNTRGLVVRDNWVHHNQGPGLWTDIDNIDSLIEGNLVEWNSDQGIKHEISYAAVIRDNIARFNGLGFDVWMWGAQILVQNSPDVEVYDNLAVVHPDGGDGIAVINQDRADNGAYGDWVSTGITVRDNVIVYLGEAGQSGIVDDIGGQFACSEEAGNEFRSNLYHVEDESVTHWRWCFDMDWSSYMEAEVEPAAEVHAPSDGGVELVGSACCSEGGWPEVLAARVSAPGVPGLNPALGEVAPTVAPTEVRPPQGAEQPASADEDRSLWLASGSALLLALLIAALLWSIIRKRPRPTAQGESRSPES